MEEAALPREGYKTRVKAEGCPRQKAVQGRRLSKAEGRRLKAEG
jgi:hypothetical protein